MSEFNVVDSLFKGLNVPTKAPRYQCRTYWRTGAILTRCPSYHHQQLIWVPVGVGKVWFIVV